MKGLRFILISVFIFTANGYAATLPKTLLIQCDNGVEATINIAQMDVSGLKTLKYKGVVEQDDEKVIMVYGNNTKVMIQYVGPKVFLQDRNRWIPCNTYRAN
ncbi:MULTISPECIES: hypothetical protein [Dickeya]|uniref:Uncharacterized protein n=1 Tax=Dickeya lacustris TaxID=2259638 RepID=A0ABY8G5I0_9GAMM|nr:MULTISPECIES: hypothetical protein [Dickeya]WFN55193.1 hypothetical protein O1Q98_16455 [Dickeya lacustris]WJM85446.1 hypothetical protein QUF31_20675 [Dickeya chrysanthemi]